MSRYAELVFAIFLPVASCYAALTVIGGWRRFRRSRYRPAPPEPLGRLEGRLRRLRAELEETEAQPGLTAKGHKVRALRGAYVDVLGDACRRLEVSPPQGGDLAPLAEVYRVEAALRDRGLDVRQTAVH